MPDVPWPPVDRAAADVAAQVAAAVRVLVPGFSDGTWPLPARWRALAELGAHDLVLARLMEGHLDAVTILAEAGRTPGAGVYGVWASASGGTGLTARPDGATHPDGPDGWIVDGTMRYATGAEFLDRGLVVLATDDDRDERLLCEIDVAAHRGRALRIVDGSWRAVGMDASASVDVEVSGLRVDAADLVGPPGFYLDRPGFAVGGAGVAAVWLGGAEGLLRRSVGAMAGRVPSVHALAHLGAVRTSVAAARALLHDLAARLGEDGPTASTPDDVALVRAAVDAAVGEALVRVPRLTGPTPLTRDSAFAHQLADLQVYVRQHHAEADLERLGAALLAASSLRVCTPRGHAPEVWADVLRGLPDVELPTSPGRVVVVAAHPDDETLGAAGLVQRLIALGHDVEVVVATDGEAAYGLPFPQRQELADRRREEVLAAVGVLGVPGVPLSVGLPDGEITDHDAELEEVLADRLAGAVLCLAHWEHDPHPDHAAAGRAALAAGARLGVPVWRFPIWMRHRLDPSDTPVSGMVVLRLDAQEQAVKDKALAAHASQVQDAPPGIEPILPDHVVALFRDGLEPLVVS